MGLPTYAPAMSTGKIRSGLQTAQTGAPGTIRTCDPLVRSQVLYPAELRVREGAVL